MAKTKISEYSTTAANNTDLNGISCAEGMAPSDVNNWMRELMKQLKEWQSGSVAQDLNVNGAFTASGNAVLSANLTVGSAASVGGNLTVTGGMTCSGAVVMSSNLSVTGNITTNGNETINGNVTLGNASTDAHTLNGLMTLATGSKIYLDDSITTAAAPSLSFDGDTDTGVFRPAANVIAFSAGGTERMRVNGDGRLLFGLTSYTAGTGPFVVGIGAGGSITAQGTSQAWHQAYVTDAGTNRKFFRYGNDQGNWGVQKVTDDYTSSTTYLSISGTNGVMTSQPTYDNTVTGSAVVVTSAGVIGRTSSSIKYKKDVEDLYPTIATNAITNLRPVWYRNKTNLGDDKPTWSQIGLIAEEVHLVEPRLVKYKTVSVTQDSLGRPTETPLAVPEPEDVDYARLSVLLLAEVKRQKQVIDNLTSRVEALEKA